MTIQPEYRYQPIADLLAREVGDEIYLIRTTVSNKAEDAGFRLDGVARSVWLQMDGSTSVSQIVAAVASEYDASEALIEVDVMSFLAQLLEQKIIRQT